MPTLDGENYLSLATFRKNGKQVATPVWFAPDTAPGLDRLYGFSMADSGKVKRLRNSGRSRIAACDVRGNVTGDWIDAETRLLVDRAEQETARLALRHKYRVQMFVTDLFGRVTGRISRRAYFEISPGTKD